MERNFFEMLKRRWDKGCFTCVGLDTDFPKIPEFIRKKYESVKGKGIAELGIDEVIFEFNRAIIDATHEFLCAYKPNSAFYEAEDIEGLIGLKKTIAYIRENYPDIPIILDAKRTDIGNTNKGYVKSAFDINQADAITVNPYFGKEALTPFLERKDKGIIVLCRTSNPGAAEFQDLIVESETGKVPLYQKVAYNVYNDWNENSNCCLVVGATYPGELTQVRQIAPDMPILLPGIGAQKGDVKKTVKAGVDENGQGIIVNSARGIIFASSKEDFKEAAKREAYKLNFLINYYREREQIVDKIFSDTKAIITDSHIVYTKGQHGSAYVNKDAIYPYTGFTSHLCQFIAEYYKYYPIDAVVAPAIGGVVLTQWAASHLSIGKESDVLALYAEKITDENNKEVFIIKRGQDKYIAGKNILILEDVITTGGSIEEVIKVVKKLDGNVVGAAILCNRNPNNVTAKSLEIPELFALKEVPLEAFEPDDCPLCKENIPINTDVGKGREFLAQKQKTG